MRLALSFLPFQCFGGGTAVTQYKAFAIAKALTKSMLTNLSRETQSLIYWLGAKTVDIIDF